MFHWCSPMFVLCLTFIIPRLEQVCIEELEPFGVSGGITVGGGKVYPLRPKALFIFLRILYENATYNIQCILSPLDSTRQALSSIHRSCIAVEAEARIFSRLIPMLLSRLQCRRAVLADLRVLLHSFPFTSLSLFLSFLSLLYSLTHTHVHWKLNATNCVRRKSKRKINSPYRTKIANSATCYKILIVYFIQTISKSLHENFEILTSNFRIFEFLHTKRKLFYFYFFNFMRAKNWSTYLRAYQKISWIIKKTKIKV